jgi:hypothetical protein
MELIDKTYPRTHVLAIATLNMLSVVVGLGMLLGPFLKHYYPGSFETTVHVALGGLIFIVAIFRAALGYGAIWMDVVLAAMGLIVFMLPTTMHMRWNGSYTMAHWVAGGVVMAVAVISALMTIPVNSRRNAGQ